MSDKTVTMSSDLLAEIVDYLEDSRAFQITVARSFVDPEDRQPDYRIAFRNEKAEKIKTAISILNSLLAAPAEELRAVLAQEAGKCEPVKWERKSKMHDGCWYPLHVEDIDEARRGGYEVRALYTSPPAPVSMVLPERFHQIMKFLNGDSDLDGFWFGDTRHGWGQFWWRLELRAVLDKVKELNQ